MWSLHIGEQYIRLPNYVHLKLLYRYKLTAPINLFIIAYARISDL
jgi:hypothetical protein